MNWIDLALLAVFVLFGVRGYFKGLFREIFSLMGLALGFIAAVRFDERAGALGQIYWHTSPLIVKGAAFVAIFFLVYFLLNLIGWLLHQSEKMLFLQTFNRIGGVTIGIGKGVAVMALLFLFLSSASWLPNSTKDQLHGAYFVSPLSRLGEDILRVGKEKLFPEMRDEAKNSSSVMF